MDVTYLAVVVVKLLHGLGDGGTSDGAGHYAACDLRCRFSGGKVALRDVGRRLLRRQPHEPVSPDPVAALAKLAPVVGYPVEAVVAEARCGEKDGSPGARPGPRTRLLTIHRGARLRGRCTAILGAVSPPSCLIGGVLLWFGCIDVAARQRPTAPVAPPGARPPGRSCPTHRAGTVRGVAAGPPGNQ